MKAEMLFFQIWNPGGLQEASRGSISVWNFDFFQKVQKTNWNLQAKVQLRGSFDLDAADFLSRYYLVHKILWTVFHFIYRMKIMKNRWMNAIIFPFCLFSESWDVTFFKSETQEASRRLPEALFWYEILKFFKIFKEKQNFQIQIELRQAS